VSKKAAISIPTIFLTMSSVVIFSLITLILYQNMGNFNIVLGYSQTRGISLLLADRMINSADCLAYEGLSYLYSPIEDNVIEYRRIYPGIIDARKLLIKKNNAAGVPKTLSSILVNYNDETDEELLEKIQGSNGFVFKSLYHPDSNNGRLLEYCPYAMKRVSYNSNYYCEYLKNDKMYDFSDWLMFDLGKNNEVSSVVLTMNKIDGGDTSFYIFLSVDGVDWEVVEATGTGTYDNNEVFPKNYRYAIVALKKPEGDSPTDSSYELSGLSFGGIGNNYQIARNFPINIGFECANMFINKGMTLKQAVENYDNENDCESNGYNWDPDIEYCYDEKEVPYKGEIIFEVEIFDAQTEQKWFYNNGVCGDDENDYCLPFDIHYPIKIRFEDGTEHYGDFYLTSYFNYNPEDYDPYEQT